jgi:hypothetical protein
MKHALILTAIAVLLVLIGGRWRRIVERVADHLDDGGILKVSAGSSAGWGPAARHSAGVEPERLPPCQSQQNFLP